MSYLIFNTSRCRVKASSRFFSQLYKHYIMYNTTSTPISLCLSLSYYKVKIVHQLQQGTINKVLVGSSCTKRDNIFVLKAVNFFL